MPKRSSFTNTERRALREKHALAPSLSQRELCQWFESVHKKPISQVTVSESLSRRFEHLDGTAIDSVKTIRPDQRRQRKEAWQELETALYEWQRREEKDLPITGDLLRAQAAWFWHRLPQYRDQPEPAFSNGWLHNYVKRHKGLRARYRHGEAGSVDEGMYATELALIKARVADYSLENRYNCDETGLYWKKVPDKTYTTTEDLAGFKIQKERVSVHFCVNATGTHKLAPWIIGRWARPMCFRAAGVRIENLNMTYHSNAASWMTTVIMIPWLRWFDQQVTGRKVILLMDNFSAHTAAAELLEAQGPEFGLKNTEIVFLPPNSTSKLQPLDQGMIGTFKLFYRRRWLRYMLEERRADRDPYKTVNLLKAIRFLLRSWDEVLPSTVLHCWQHAGLAQAGAEVVPPVRSLEAERDVLRALSDLQSMQVIREAMSLAQIMNPADEIIEDNAAETAEQIASQFDAVEECDSEEEGVEELPLVTAMQALQFVDGLRLHEEQSNDCNNDWIRSLYRYEKVLQGRVSQRRQQQPLEAFFQSYTASFGD